MKDNGFTNLTAIKDDEIKNFIIESASIEKFLYDKSIVNEFKENFLYWIKKTDLNEYKNIDSFKNIQITNGSVHTFDHFYLKHKNKRIMTMNGEFMYHKGSLKHDFRFATFHDIEIFKERVLVSNDEYVFIISVPFTGYGRLHDQFFDWMNICEENHIPVLLDFCHAPVSKNVFLDLDQFSCVETLAFSISKPFYGGENLRVGLRFQRDNHDDGIDILNSSGIEMLNLIGIGISNELIKKYNFDYNWNTYGKLYSQVCSELRLNETNNILYGIGGEEYNEYDRSGVNRICLSDEISKRL